MAVARDLTTADLSWRDGRPYSERFGDVYHADTRGQAEAVFLRHNELPARWQAAGERFVIGELGFGTACNFLSTWRAWRTASRRPARLHYVAVERFPVLPADLLRACEASDPALAPLAARLVASYPHALPGPHQIAFVEEDLWLTLIFDDVVNALDHWCAPADGEVDAWYLDGFAPACNPEMWSSEVMVRVANLTRADGTFATYAAAGAVRRALDAAGFDVHRAPGFAGKRELLCGKLRARPPRARVEKPWFELPPRPVVCERRALVIGAGLAGCAAAASLAVRGYEIDVIESATGVATAASGFHQSIFHPVLHQDHSLRGRHGTESCEQLVRHLQSLSSGSAPLAWQLCGALHPACDAKQVAQQRELRGDRAVSRELLRWVNAAEASELCGLKLSLDGFFLPSAGWVHAPHLCAANLATKLGRERIRLLTGRAVARLERVGEEWRAFDSSAALIAAAPIAIIANARDALAFTELASFPLARLRGQVSIAPTTPARSALKTVLYFGGYLTPVLNGRHTLGATYGPRDAAPAVQLEDDDANLARLGRNLPEVAATFALTRDELTNRAGQRTTSPDHLPLVGPAPDFDSYARDYAGLEHGPRHVAFPVAKYLPGLYVTVGHGSRGAAGTQLAAELLAAQIAGDPLPLESTMIDALHPARFNIRAQKRARCE
ncbi:MAG: bifunctional tRNA (5-methylaminomethyl-2-thiouridine)(34)-methyltransferase MnmD/FAD-dependent 5-carboxymethylaminomethyl-2-thiouridine(34) oxidoreductase MnmC [Planctomycetota bacterium]